MRNLEYKDFSFQAHKASRRLGRPALCQFELTFACPLHCRYCYSDCYNRRQFIRRQLSTKKVFAVLDKLYDYGILWLGLTGGDPLARSDFADIYAYAHSKGFIITVFTSGMLIDKEVIGVLEMHKPFCVELTLNSLDPHKLDRISGGRGVLKRVMASIGMLKASGIAFKIKSMALKDNHQELNRIKSFAAGLGCGYQVSSLILPRLDRDSSVCALRLDASSLIRLDGSLGLDTEFCRGANQAPKGRNRRLFRCNAARDGFGVDPCGRMFLCTAVRTPSFDLGRYGIEKGMRALSRLISQDFRKDSPCAPCQFLDSCRRCPGRALLESGDMHKAVAYYCDLAQACAQRTAS